LEDEGVRERRRGKLMREFVSFYRVNKKRMSDFGSF